MSQPIKCPFCSEIFGVDSNKVEWISVKIHWPPIHEDVLVFNRGKMEVRFRLEEEYPDDPELCNRIVWSEQGICNEIEWWRYLPEPPK
jgi:hypothetical protein